MALVFIELVNVASIEKILKKYYQAWKNDYINHPVKKQHFQKLLFWNTAVKKGRERDGGREWERVCFHVVIVVEIFIIQLYNSGKGALLVLCLLSCACVYVLVRERRSYGTTKTADGR